MLSPNPNEIFKCSLSTRSVKKQIVDIASTKTFADFHKIIQKFGHWDNWHLHDFKIYIGSTNKTGIKIAGLQPDGKPMNIAEEYDYSEENVCIGNLISLDNYRMKYTYDFGEENIVYIRLLEIIKK